MIPKTSLRVRSTASASTTDLGHYMLTTIVENRALRL